MSDFDSTPFPIGGSRVPNSMNSQSDWRSLHERSDESTESVDYGSEYTAAEKERNQLGELKKRISALLVPIAAIDKNQQLIDDPANESRRAKISALNDTETERYNQAVASLLELQSQLPANSEWREVITTINQAIRPGMSRSDFVKVNDDIKLHTTTIFRQQNQLLTQMKAIKKAHRS